MSPEYGALRRPAERQVARGVPARLLGGRRSLAGTGREAQSNPSTTLDRLESAVGDEPGLTGEQYGLANISWVVNINHLNQAQVDLARWRRRRAWGERAMAQPAFDKAVASSTPTRIGENTMSSVFEDPRPPRRRWPANVSI